MSSKKGWTVAGRFASLFLFSCLWAAPLCAAPASFSFKPAVQVTTDTQYNYRMSRNPGGQIAFDTSKTLHLVYWSGYFATNPQNPATVFYRSWARDRGWSSEEFVDNSIDSSDRRMGGRHPSMAIDGSNGVWVAWHDHRHSPPEPPYNGINNLEIYCDYRPPGGNFSETDIRLTNTSAPHFGDNGYCPRIAVAPNGEVSVVWYDFHADGSASDIFLQTSDTSGTFDQTSSVLSQRITNADNRSAAGGQPFKPAFNMPDLAITSTGTRLIIWTQDFGGVVGNANQAPIYFAQHGSQPAELPYTAAVSGNDGYWFPPKIKLAPNGDVWLIYTVNTGGGVRQVEISRRRAASATFDSPRRLTATGSNENADLAIDPDGRLHVVWVSTAGYQSSHVNYLLYDYETDGRLKEIVISDGPSGWAGPSIALDSDALPYIVYGNFQGESLGDQGSIWFVEPEAHATVRDWVMY